MCLLDEGKYAILTEQILGQVMAQPFPSTINITYFTLTTNKTIFSKRIIKSNTSSGKQWHPFSMTSNKTILQCQAIGPFYYDNR